VCASELPPGAPIEKVSLPPFVVNELPEGLPWRYARVEGIEILTLAPTELTRSFVEAYLRGTRFVSPVFLGKRDEPVSFVVFDHKSDALSPVRELPENARWRPGTTSFLGSMVQSEGGSLIFAANLNGVDRWPMVSAGLAQRLLMESTNIPRWLTEALYGPSGCFYAVAGHYERPVVDVPSFRWVSEEISTKLREKRCSLPELLPLSNFFGSMPNRETDTDAFRVWSSQAGLFARWQLFGGNGRPLDPIAFWGFALEARSRPVDESMFQRWFKKTYAEAEIEMLDYLRLAVASPESFEIRDLNRPLPELNALRFQPATEEEVARLKGNFERMEAKRLRPKFPELAKKYTLVARRTFQRGLKGNPASGTLRSLLGQLELDAGNPEAARPLLEYGFAQNSMGTGALIDLARLRLDESRQGLSPDAKLPGGALERVLTPLFAARSRQPAILEVYQLISAIWDQSSVPPTKGHLAVLVEGARFFRDEADFVVKAVELHRRHGFTDEADALLAFGENWARDDAARARYAALRASRRSEAATGAVSSESSTATRNCAEASSPGDAAMPMNVIGAWLIFPFFTHGA